MSPMFKLALAFASIALALVLGATASRLTRENVTPTPDPRSVDEAPRTPVRPTPPPATPNIVVINTPIPGDGALPITFTCPPGWTAQNITARRYAFCTPPGWVARIGPAGVPRFSEVEGSMVRVVSPQQVAVSGTPRTGTSLTPASAGSVVDIYVTSYQITADLPKQPLCSGASTSVGRVVVVACDLDNTAEANAPFRYRALYGRLSEDTFLHCS